MRKDADFSNFQRINTPDGSYTYFFPDFRESYHSVFGARSESEYVFIQNGLQFLKKKEINVCETGFGTGLNTLLSMYYAHSNDVQINYETCEILPIPTELLPLPPFASSNQFLTESWRMIHQCSWNQFHTLSGYFRLRKMHQSLTDFVPANKADIWFHDAFSPKNQPELWSSEIFNHISRHLAPGGCLVTYSAAGLVKNSLRSAGFKIERLQGPPGKKHMLRAYW